MKYLKRFLPVVLVVTILLMSSFPAMAEEYEAPEVITDDAVLYLPENPAETGFIFYCGAFVDYLDYSGILGGLAERGYFTASLECPLDISMLNPFGALTLMQEHPEITHWFIGGHSQGGVMASALCNDLVGCFDGLILLASYSIVPVTVPTLSMYGTNDGVLVMPLYWAFRPMIAGDLTEIVVDGGNHAQWGNYGFQFMDREASISIEEQQHRAIDAIDLFMKAKI